MNPVIIRKTLSQLKKAGLIHVARGTGGATLSKTVDEISLLDIYRAVECLGTTGQLDGKLATIQIAMEKEMARTSLKEVVITTQKKIDQVSVS